MNLTRCRRRPPVLAILAAIVAPTLAIAEPPPAPPLPTVPGAPRTTGVVRVPVTSFAVEPDGAPTAATTASPFAPATTRLPASGSVLTAPVTLGTTGSADAFTATANGAGRAVTGLVTSSGNGLSAVKGQTAGSGAGVNGVTTGTTGNSGKFQSTNASSTQPGMTSTTAGTNSAIVGVVSNAGGFDAAAVTGQHNGNAYYGIGVEGDGGYVGVKGIGYIGLIGDGTSIGLESFGSAYGVLASSSSTTSGYGVYGSSNGSSGFGLYGYNSSSGYAGYFYGAGGVGIRAGTGNPSGSYAGIFDGPVFVSAAMYATSYNSSSDRAVKQSFHDIDGADILQRVEAMPIGGWDFQATPGIHHIGPMAQDFRSAFGLGVDDKHIDMSDGLGVSLAAIQALKRQVDAKEASNAELRARVAALEGQVALAQETLAARLTALEQAAQGQSLAAATVRP